MAANALGRHLALAGFMGAGKTTIGREVARRLDRPFVDLDHEIEREAGATIEDLFARDGEPGFRLIEAGVAASMLDRPEPAVIALGGGAVISPDTRDLLSRRAFTVLLEIDPDTAWQRVRQSRRPLAIDEESFHSLFRDRLPLYEEVANAHAHAYDADGVILAAAAIEVRIGAIDLLEELVPGEGSVEIVSDANVAGIHGVTAQLALGDRDIALHEVPPGEPAKVIAVLERLWRALRIGRDGTIVGLGGGCTTDLAGFAAATYMRGVPWVAVPTTLVGQVDAAIGGKTAVDLPGGKNLIGAFHWPARVVIDPGTLETLPEQELRNGMAEAVKTGLLMGRPVWELSLADLVRRCAAFKAAVCIADPHDRGVRNQLNLGHTFGHALEAAAGYDLPHGQAVALGMVAALQLSGNDAALAVVREQLDPQPVKVDRELAWAALARDKKTVGGAPRLVLLERNGEPTWGNERPAVEIRAALDDLIVD
jgi:shikimate kinase / 3-dehydroquinate synthase